MTLDEPRARRELLEQYLSERKLSAAVICAEGSFYYFSGFLTTTWANRARPMFLVMRPGRPLAAVVSAAEADAIATRCDGVEAVAYLEPEVRHEGGYVELEFMSPATATVLDLLREVAPAAIGLELSSHFSPFATPALVDACKALGAELVDIAPQIWTMRRRKSPDEVRRLQAAACALDRTYELFQPHIRTESSEREIQRALLSAAGEAGADRLGYSIVAAGVGGAVQGAPTDRRWSADDLLLVDTGIVVDGYWADCCRLYAATAPSKRTLNAYTQVVEALSAARAAIAPGVTLQAAAAAVAECVGAPDGSAYGRAGHGIGLDITEPPSLHHLDDTVLEAGMVLCIEPNGWFDGVGYLSAEEMIVVTEDGSELLTQPFPASLPVLGR